MNRTATFSRHRFRNVSAAICLWSLLVGASARAEQQDYFAAGPWRLGMKLEQALPLFESVEAAEAGKSYRAVAASVFGQDVPAQLSFSRRKLVGVELMLYDGQDQDAAIENLLSVLGYFRDHFGGGSFEGLTTAEDADGALTRIAVEGTIAKLTTTMEEVRSENGSDTTFTLRMSFYPVGKAKGNHLYGQLRFEENTKRYAITLWEDPKFIRSRLPEALVHLHSPDEQAP